MIQTIATASQHVTYDVGRVALLSGHVRMNIFSERHPNALRTSVPAYGMIFLVTDVRISLENAYAMDTSSSHILIRVHSVNKATCA